MVRVARKRLKGKLYYYLEHTVRDDGRRTTRSKYLGVELPEDLEASKRRFEHELNKEKWFGDFEEIRRNYNLELRTMPGSTREKAFREFSVRFTYDTQRIEGSTLTLRETSDLLERKVSPGGKPTGDAKEAEAHNVIFREMLRLRGGLSQTLVQEWNWRLLAETEPDVAGRIRRHGVRISGSRFVPPSPVELQPRLDEFFDWYKHAEPTNPVELAGLAHLKFVTIHPFADGNGRVSRLIMNFVLHKEGYPMLNIEYSRRRTYYTTLERSQLRGDERPFMNWFFRRYRQDNLRYLPSR